MNLVLSLARNNTVGISDIRILLKSLKKLENYDCTFQIDQDFMLMKENLEFLINTNNENIKHEKLIRIQSVIQTQEQKQKEKEFSQTLYKLIQGDTFASKQIFFNLEKLISDEEIYQKYYKVIGQFIEDVNYILKQLKLETETKNEQNQSKQIQVNSIESKNQQFKLRKIIQFQRRLQQIQYKILMEQQIDRINFSFLLLVKLFDQQKPNTFSLQTKVDNFNSIIQQSINQKLYGKLFWVIRIKTLNSNLIWFQIVKYYWNELSDDQIILFDQNFAAMLDQTKYLKLNKGQNSFLFVFELFLQFYDQLSLLKQKEKQLSNEKINISAINEFNKRIVKLFHIELVQISNKQYSPKQMLQSYIGLKDQETAFKNFNLNRLNTHLLYLLFFTNIKQLDEKLQCLIVKLFYNFKNQYKQLYFNLQAQIVYLFTKIQNSQNWHDHFSLKNRAQIVQQVSEVLAFPMVKQLCQKIEQVNQVIDKCLIQIRSDLKEQQRETIKFCFNQIQEKIQNLNQINQGLSTYIFKSQDEKERYEKFERSLNLILINLLPNLLILIKQFQEIIKKIDKQDLGSFNIKQIILQEYQWFVSDDKRIFFSQK